MPSISVPKGYLRLASLKMLSESSLSGTDLARQVSRATSGEWNPGPGSIYLVLGELLRKGYITELPKREGNVRRYIISGKGKEELGRLVREADADVLRQVRLLAVYTSLAGKKEISAKVQGLAESLQKRPG